MVPVALPPSMTRLVDCNALEQSPAMVDACEWGKARNFSLEPPDIRSMAEAAGEAAAASACASMTYGATTAAEQMGLPNPCKMVAGMVSDLVFSVASKVVTNIKGILGMRPSKAERVRALTGEYRDKIAQTLVSVQELQTLMQRALDEAAAEAVDIYDLVLPEYAGRYTEQMAKQRLASMGLPLVNEWIPLEIFSGQRFTALIDARERREGLLAPDLYRIVYGEADRQLRVRRLGSALSTYVEREQRGAKQIETEYEAALEQVTALADEKEDFATEWLQQLEVLSALLVAYVGERAGALIRLEHAREIEGLHARYESAARRRAFWEAAYREQQLWRQRQVFAGAIGLLVWGGGSYASYKQQWGWLGYLGAFGAGFVGAALVRGKSPQQRFAEAAAAKQATGRLTF